MGTEATIVAARLPGPTSETVASAAGRRRAPNPESVWGLDPERPISCKKARERDPVAALDRCLEIAVARQSLRSRLDSSPLVLVGRDRRAKPRFEPGIDAARNAPVDDLAEAPVRRCERQERERDQRGDQLELEASHLGLQFPPRPADIRSRTFVGKGGREHESEFSAGAGGTSGSRRNRRGGDRPEAARGRAGFDAEDSGVVAVGQGSSRPSSTGSDPRFRCSRPGAVAQPPSRRARSFRRPSDPRRFLPSDPRHSPPTGRRSGICRGPAILCPSRRRSARSHLRSRRPRPLRHPHRLPRPCRLRLLHRFRFPLPNPSPPWRHGSLPRCPSAQLSLSRPASAGKSNAKHAAKRPEPKAKRPKETRPSTPAQPQPAPAQSAQAQPHAESAGAGSGRSRPCPRPRRPRRHPPPRRRCETTRERTNLPAAERDESGAKEKEKERDRGKGQEKKDG